MRVINFISVALIWTLIFRILILIAAIGLVVGVVFLILYLDDKSKGYPSYNKKKVASIIGFSVAGIGALLIPFLYIFLTRIIF